MTRSSMIKATVLAGAALLWATGLCLAQSHASRQTEQELAAHKDLAKTHLKGELLDGYNKALTQTPSAALAGADRIRVDAEAVAQCNAFLVKTVPHMHMWALRMRREYSRLQSENQALHAEYARLQNLPKWAQKYQLEAIYQQKLARHIVAYKIYLAKRQAGKAMLLGITFCLRIIQQHDPQLGARWAGEMSRLQVAR
jgi:hypothetical protein